MPRRGRGFWAQLAFTVLVAAFLVVPVVMSITAGLTVNFFQGVKSGLTLRWIGEVWRLYRETIVLSLTIALACLAVDLAGGVPAAYVLAKARSPRTRPIEEGLVLPIAVPGVGTAPALVLAHSYASMRLEIGSAYTLVFFFMIIPLLIGIQWAGRK